jgi:hypothetical protein
MNAPAPYPSARHLIEVRQRNLRWEVAVDGVTRRMIDWLCTRERALDHALDLAQQFIGTPAREPVHIVVEGAPHLERRLV